MPTQAAPAPKHNESNSGVMGEQTDEHVTKGLGGGDDGASWSVPIIMAVVVLGLGAVGFVMYRRRKRSTGFLRQEDAVKPVHVQVMPMAVAELGSVPQQEMGELNDAALAARAAECAAAVKQ